MSTNHIASTEIATQTINTSLSFPNLSCNAVIGDPLVSNGELKSFDLITNLVTSPVTLANELVQPKILKMIDSIQNFLDLNNEKLIEQIGKNREHQLIDLTKKSSDLNHRQKLQSLLIESIGLNDFRKASFIFSYLNENNSSTQLAAINELNSQTISDENTNNFHNREVMDENETFMNDLESSPNKNESYNKKSNHTNNASNLIIDYEDDPLETHSHLHHQPTHLQNNYSNSNSSSNSSRCSNFNNNKLFTNAHNSSSSISAVEYNSINLNDSIRDAFSKAKKSNPLSPIRHLICSPGLEAKAQNCKIIILYKGRCNGICYQNKPWSKEMHIHYIINTVNCNDHVSRLVKKQGIQFYNSFVLQNQERIKQLIQMYKMEKV